MKRILFVGMVAVCLGAGVFCEAAEAENSSPALPAFPGSTREYADAVNLFMKAKRSDNPQRSYSSCIEAFRGLAQRAGGNSELRIRCEYLIGFSMFLQRDFDAALTHVEQVMSLGKGIFKGKPFAAMAANLPGKINDGEASFPEVQVAMKAGNAADAALLAGALLRYSQTKDTCTDNNKKVVDEKRLQSAAVALSLYGMVFGMPMNEMIEKVNQAECVSHLHELIAAWRKYRDDHDGMPVPTAKKIADTGKSWLDTASWVNLMQAYIDDPKLKVIQPNTPNVLLSRGTCLSCSSFIKKQDGRGADISSHCPHFGMNAAAFDKNGKISDSAMVFIDVNAFFVLSPAWGLDSIEYRHSGGVNCAFADGHVEWLSREEIEKSAKTWQNSPFWSSSATK